MTTFLALPPTTNPPERLTRIPHASDDSVIEVSMGVPRSNCEVLAYPRQLRYDDRHQRQEIDCEISQIIMGIMSAQQEQADWHAQQELLRRSVLVTIVNLLPHVQIVVGARIELEGDSTNPMKHEV